MKTLMLGTMIALSGVVSCAMAEGNVMARALESCGQDIDTHCSHVKPGEGRITGCLYSNDDKISSQCGMALIDVALQFETVTAQASEVIYACETEREAFCPTAVWGDGGIVKCLTTQSRVTESVSTGCRLTLEKFGLI